METARTEKVSLTHNKILTDIMIGAPPAEVSAVPRDTGSYGDWAAFATITTSSSNRQKTEKPSLSNRMGLWAV